MEDFTTPVPVVLRELSEAGLLHQDVVTVSGRTIWENVKAECYNRRSSILSSSHSTACHRGPRILLEWRHR
jgi:dihydroxyacid dehydratase/phosphogluconate dehydratase